MTDEIIFNDEVEEWKELPNLSKYFISSFGRIKNKQNKIISQQGNEGNNEHETDYKRVTLICDDNPEGSRGTKFRVHRLVASAFVENPDPENKNTVNHKDGRKLNNRASNLEWMTNKEQNIHKTKCSPEILECIGARAVWRIDNISNEKLQKYNSIKQASRWIYDNNFTECEEFNNGNNIKQNISQVCLGHRPLAYKHKWAYDDTENNLYEDEEWKDITPELIHFNINKYQVSNYGRIRNSLGRLNKISITPDGYSVVDLSKKRYRVNRLVALMFIDNPENKPEVNHIDGNDKTDNSIWNLEWVTRSENCKHAHKTGLQTRTKKINQYTNDMVFVNQFNSLNEAEKAVGLSRQCIANCCQGNIDLNNKRHPWIFKYAEEN